MKHLTIMTHAPQGTLGDPTLCTVLAENLQKQYPDLKIKIVVALIDKPGHWRAVDNIIKHNDNVEIECIPGLLGDLSYPQKQELYNNTDGVIIYPTFHFLNTTERLEFEKLREKIPVLFVTNYNFQMQHDYNKKNQTHMAANPNVKLSSYEELLNSQVIVETGIGLNAKGERLAGVNLSDKEMNKAVYLDGKDKSDLNESDLKSIRGILQLGKDAVLDNVALADYKSRNDLYFGYYNNLALEAKTNWANAANFVKLAVLDSMEKNPVKKNIDIVIPLNESADSKKSGNNFENIKSKLDLTQVTVEVWEKDPATGELVKKKSEGNGPTTVRLINAFPFAKSTMDLMHRMSEPLTLMTGNSSMSEAIEYDKIPLYQIMSWHTRLDKDLLSAISSDPPFQADHPYRQFHEMMRATMPEKEEKLAKFLNENREQILAGAKVFHTFVNENYNLKENLPREVSEKIQAQQLAIQQRPATSQQVVFGAQSEQPSQQFNEYCMRFESDYDNYKNNGILNPNVKNDLLLIGFIKNDLAIVRNLLTAGANPNYTADINGSKYNPLYFCLKQRIDEKLLTTLHNTDNFDPVQGMKVIRETILATQIPINIGSYVDTPSLGPSAFNISAYTSGPSEPQQLDKLTYMNPYFGLKEGMPRQKMLEMLIQSAKKAGKNPMDLFEKDEVREFYAHPGTTYNQGTNFDIIYLDILIRENVVSPSFQNFMEVSNFYNNNYEYKFLEKDKWRVGLKNNYSNEQMGLRLVESGYERYKEDHDYLREVLLSQEGGESNLLTKLMVEYTDNELLKTIAKQILTPDELEALLEDVERQSTAMTEELHELSALAYNTSMTAEDLQHFDKVNKAKLDELTQDSSDEDEDIGNVDEDEPDDINVSNESVSEINIFSLMEKLDSLKVHNESAETVLYGEGGLLTLSGYNYIRKLQLEATMSPKGPLKNVYLTPDEHPKLNVPVFIGENGEPICLYKNNAFDAGTFGEVFLGLRVDTGEACIVKKQAINELSHTETQALVGLERFIDTHKIAENSVQYQLEAQKRVEGKNLKRVIQDENGARIEVPEDVRINMASHMAKAVSEFHAKGWLHRDINLQNIMYNPKSGQIGLVDFGFTVKADQHLQHTDDKAVGVLLCRAPELLKKDATEFVYNEQTEVYALGIALAILNSNQSLSQISEKINHKLNNELGRDQTKILQAIRESVPEIFYMKEHLLSPAQVQMNKLIQAMTDPDPNKRPKISDVHNLLQQLQQQVQVLGEHADTTKDARKSPMLVGNPLDMRHKTAPWHHESSNKPTPVAQEVAPKTKLNK